MIKESCNLIGQEAQLATPNQSQFEILPSLDDHQLHGKNLRYQLNPFRDINDQNILQSDWIREKAGHTHSKGVVSEATVPR